MGPLTYWHWQEVVIDGVSGVIAGGVLSFETSRTTTKNPQKSPSALWSCPPFIRRMSNKRVPSPKVTASGVRWTQESIQTPSIHQMAEIHRRLFWRGENWILLRLSVLRCCWCRSTCRPSELKMIFSSKCFETPTNKKRVSIKPGNSIGIWNCKIWNFFAKIP